MLVVVYCGFMHVGNEKESLRLLIEIVEIAEA